MDRVVIFVDGENFRKTINSLYTDFDQKEYLPKNAQWGDFFWNLSHKIYDGAITEWRHLRTYWYVIDRVTTYPYGNPNPRQTTIESRSEWFGKNKKIINELKKQGFIGEQDQLQELNDRRNDIKNRFERWREIQNSIANNHLSIEFRRSGEISYNLAEDKLGSEKTVDVNLAVDMFRLSNNYDLAILVSGDQDYVPAVQAVKDMGKRVVNVSFKKEDGKLLPGGARRLNDVTDWSHQVSWKDFREILGLADDKK